MRLALTPETVLALYEAATPAEPWRWHALVRCIENQWNAMPVPVRFVNCEPYSSYEEMKAHIESGDMWQVSKLHSVQAGHPLDVRIPWHYSLKARTLQCNLAFRAVHDMFGHYAADADFTWAGECAAFDHHRRLLPKSVHGILAAEVLGQAAYRIVNGAFPIQRPLTMRGFES